MEYKVGDEVRVIKDLEWDDSRFPTCGVTEEMAALRGKCVTIKCIARSGRYQTLETGKWYSWTEEMFSGIAELTLGDLETRMVVETRDKCRYLVSKEGDGVHLMNDNGETCIPRYPKFGPGYNENMKGYNPDKDIMKVFPKVDTFDEITTVNDPIWERKEPKKMTISEIEKELGYEVEVIADVER